MADSNGSFIWYELMTKDPDSAKRFYDSVVGWNIDAEPSGEMDYRMIVAGDGKNVGGVMRLTEEMTDGGAHPIWMGYLAVDDVDAAIASIEAEGGKTLMPATDMPNIGRIAMIADLHGAPMYIMRPTPPASNPDATSDAYSPTEPGHVAWNELTSPSQSKSLDFYAGQFGWEKGEVMPMGSMGEYQFINQGGEMIGGIMPDMPDQRPMWKYCFGVPVVDDAMDAIKAGAGRVISGPDEVPNGRHVVGATDPEGVEFMVVGARRPH
ncbi:MAG: VOC family protein [Gemmatimonadaceae bacterium]